LSIFGLPSATLKEPPRGLFLNGTPFAGQVATIEHSPKSKFEVRNGLYGFFEKCFVVGGARVLIINFSFVFETAIFRLKPYLPVL